MAVIQCHIVVTNPPQREIIEMLRLDRTSHTEVVRKLLYVVLVLSMLETLAPVALKAVPRLLDVVRMQEGKLRVHINSNQVGQPALCCLYVDISGVFVREDH